MGSMKSIEVQLLESLGGGVRPFDDPDGQIPSGSEGFSAMLNESLLAKPDSHLPVRFAPSVSGLFEQDQQLEISRGVDLAAAAGIEYALILHDQRTLRIDVRNRVVLDAYPTTSSDVIEGIDGFVSLQAAQSTSESTTHTPVTAPARVVRNASLVHALAGRAPIDL